MPTHALEECRSLTPGQTLYLIGSNKKRGGLVDYANSELVQIVAKRDDRLVTFRMLATSMGSIFQSELSAHWECEVAFLAGPREETRSVPTSDSSGILDPMNPGVDCALDELVNEVVIEDGLTYEFLVDQEVSKALPTIDHEMLTVLPNVIPPCQETRTSELKLGGETYCSSDYTYSAAIGQSNTMASMVSSVVCSNSAGSSGIINESIDDVPKGAEVQNRVVGDNGHRTTNDDSEMSQSSKSKAKIGANPGKTTKKHVCSTCGKVLPCLSKLIIHIQQHYRSESDRKRKSPSEASGFMAHSDTQVHYRPRRRGRRKTGATADVKSPRMYCCDKCGHIFEGYTKYKLHSRSHMRQERRDNGTFACETCGKTFAYNGQLKIHERIHTRESGVMAHSDTQVHYRPTRRGRRKDGGTAGVKSPRMYCCDKCGQIFEGYTKYKLHLRSHMRQERRDNGTFACETCGKTFAYNGQLKEHERIHTGEKPFICSVCDKAFTTKAACKLHQRTHTGEKPWICTVCGTGFTQKMSLRDHMNTHTGERPHVCDICGKGFGRVTSLRTHRRSHTGERPYPCAYCDMRFKQAGPRNAHHRRHTGEKRHKRDIPTFMEENSSIPSNSDSVASVLSLRATASTECLYTLERNLPTV